MVSELAWLVRAHAPPRAVRLSVREMLVARLERGPLGPREVGDAVESAVRAICRLVRQMDVPDEMVEAVCWSALEAVRGHGGETARWMPEARSAAYAVLEEVARDLSTELRWRRLARELSGW
jgi:hypothetical protein